MNDPIQLHASSLRIVRRAALCLTFAIASAGIGCRSNSTPDASKMGAKPARVETPHAEKALTDEQREKNLASFDQVWTTIRDKHFDPTYNGVDWNAVRDELRPKEQAATTMTEARGAMQTMLARLGQTHFAILPATLYEKIDETKKPVKKTDPDATSNDDESADDNDAADGGSGGTGGTGAMELRLVDDHVLVTKVEPDGAASRAGVRMGWELVAIRNRPIEPILAGFKKAMQPSPLRDAMSARTLESALHGRVGRSVPVTFIDQNDARITRPLKLTEEKGFVEKFGNLPDIRVTSECKRVRPNIAYYTVNIFLGPRRIMPELRKCVEAAANGANKADGFVLDLRGNPGGIGSMAIGMGNLFVMEDGQKLGVMSGRDTPEMLKFVLDQQAVTFTGPLAVLVDECSMSTSEILAGGLRDIKRARVFGVRTAGAALPSVVDQLPNGDRFQYAVANYTSAGGEVLEGHGVEPDVKVSPDRKSLLAGKDPILEAAIDWIDSQTNAKK